MTSLEQIEQRVDALRANHRDDEGAHITEDGIHTLALGCIARGITGPAAQRIAQAALKTREIPFARWYA